ncbi:MAG: DUF45 domain-containing protein [Desulfurococcales archaeon]|nr:DUF45 domain-containing protein [Desulfurococcales archaeon]
MAERGRIKKLLEQAEEALGMNNRVRIVLYPMKYKVASVSLKSKIIRINRNFVSDFDDKELYYVLVHELIHIKIASLSHGEKFYEVLTRLFSPDETEEIENGIVKKLLGAGISTKKWLT